MKFAALSLLAFLLMSPPALAQNKTYINPAFGELVKGHETIAILPLETKVALRPEVQQQMTSKAINNIEYNEGQTIQMALYSFILESSERGQFDMKVQHPQETNDLLERNGINLNELSGQSPVELAGILQVDTVVMGTMEMSKPNSETAAFVIDALTDVYVTTNRSVMNLSILNGKDGAVLFNYQRRINGAIGSLPQMLIYRQMLNASRKIAYAYARR